MVGDVEIAEHEHIHPSPQIARNSVLGTCHHRFSLIEAGVEDDRYFGQFRKFLDNAIKARVHSPIDGLNASCTVDVDSGWDQVSFVGSHSRGNCHKWIALIDFEEL